MSDPMEIVLFWLAFAATHMLLSSNTLRPKLVSKLGDGPFLGLYSLVALLIFVPLVRSYASSRHGGNLLYSIEMTNPLRWGIYIGMAMALVILIWGMLAPSPMAVPLPGQGDPFEKGPQAVHRFTRHPVFMATGLFGLLHLIPNGTDVDVAFFAGFPLFALVGCLHQDRRKLAADPQRLEPYYKETSFLPFSSGRSWMALKEVSPLALGLGIGLTVLLRTFHTQLFG